MLVRCCDKHDDLSSLKFDIITKKGHFILLHELRSMAKDNKTVCMIHG